MATTYDTYPQKKHNLKCQMKDRYLKNKMKKISQSCTCPVCKSKFVKKTKAQAFCGSRYDTTCKDAYWNFMRFGTVPDILFGYFKVLKMSEEEEKKHVEGIVGNGSDETEEEKKFTNMMIESIELGNEEKEESKTDDFNDVVPEDAYICEKDSYLI